MRRVAILTIVIGLLIGVIGGALAGAYWLGVGAVTLIAGVTALWGVAIWKNPYEAMKVEAEVETMASGYPTRMTEPTAPREIGSTPAVTLVHSEPPHK